MATKYDTFGLKPDATRELIKTRHANSSLRREYLRMKQDDAIQKRQASASVFVYQEKPVVDHRASLTAEDDVIKIQGAQPEVKTFPFVEGGGETNKSVSGNEKETKALEANPHPQHKHGAKLCMMSAMIHMKCLASRRAKSIKQLRKNPKTSLDEKLLNPHRHLNDISDEEEESEDAKLKKCRYLRGIQQERELTIDEIFSSNS